MTTRVLPHGAWRLASYVLFAVGAVVALALSGSKYDWMQDMAGGTPPVEDASNNRAAFVAVVLAIAAAPQALLIVSARERVQRIVSAILIGVAMLIGWINR